MLFQGEHEGLAGELSPDGVLGDVQTTSSFTWRLERRRQWLRSAMRWKAQASCSSPGRCPTRRISPGQLPAGIEAQTRNVMANLVAVLDSLGLGLEQVVMARAYLTHFREDYAQFNATYRCYFPVERLPARTCVGVTGLAYDARVEIDLVCRCAAV